MGPRRRSSVGSHRPRQGERLIVGRECMELCSFRQGPTTSASARSGSRVSLASFVVWK